MFKNVMDYLKILNNGKPINNLKLQFKILKI
jgi:hypothetical protein